MDSTKLILAQTTWQEVSNHHTWIVAYGMIIRWGTWCGGLVGEGDGNGVFFFFEVSLDCHRFYCCRVEVRFGTHPTLCGDMEYQKEWPLIGTYFRIRYKHVHALTAYLYSTLRQSVPPLFWSSIWYSQILYLYFLSEEERLSSIWHIPLIRLES